MLVDLTWEGWDPCYEDALNMTFKLKNIHTQLPPIKGIPNFMVDHRWISRSAVFVSQDQNVLWTNAGSPIQHQRCVVEIIGTPVQYVQEVGTKYL